MDCTPLRMERRSLPGFHVGCSANALSRSLLPQGEETNAELTYSHRAAKDVQYRRTVDTVDAVKPTAMAAEHISRVLDVEESFAG